MQTARAACRIERVTLLSADTHPGCDQNAHKLLTPHAALGMSAIGGVRLVWSHAQAVAAHCPIGAAFPVRWLSRSGSPTSEGASTSSGGTGTSKNGEGSSDGMPQGESIAVDTPLQDLFMR